MYNGIRLVKFIYRDWVGRSVRGKMGTMVWLYFRKEEKLIYFMNYLLSDGHVSGTIEKWHKD